MGGQILIPFELNTIIALEGKYWFFPSFSEGKSTVEDLRTSSLWEGLLIYQRRISYTPISFRLGAVGIKIPVVNDLGGSTLASQTELDFRSVLLGGPLVGIKIGFDRDQGKGHFIYIDIAPLLYTDNQLFNKMGSSYLFRGGLKWFLTDYLAVTLDGEMKRFFTKNNDQVNSLIGGAGLQLFLF